MRSEAIRALGRLRFSKVASVLEQFIRDDEQFLFERLRAMDALAGTDETVYLQTMVRLLKVDAIAIQLRAVNVLGGQGDALMIPHLERLQKTTRNRSTKKAVDEAIVQIKARMLETQKK